MYFICVYAKRIYITFIINCQIKAYINGIIGLFLVSQPSLPTTLVIMKSHVTTQSVLVIKPMKLEKSMHTVATLTSTEYGCNMADNMNDCRSMTRHINNLRLLY